MKKELLSPAGDFESLKAAVHAGADAIYIGGRKFGARKFAPNFSLEEIESAVRYAHLYGVKIYVTVNTMIYEDEMEEVLDYVSELYKIGVDALIVQDIGLIRLIKKYFPNLEIHASTQAHNYQKESFDLLEELGVTRVVLARECRLDEIESIDTSLEKEAFIHGAICISYSGQCLFSSLVLGRSGNRGACAGMCRLPYSLEDENGKVLVKDKYLLSPKELWTIPKFKELMDSDIKSFKIEGRMKSPAYVYLVTKIYRTLMDQYANGEDMFISSSMIEDLKLIYNREFTLGHLFSDNDFMNIDSPNHVGVPLGKVVSFTKDKIKILLDKDLEQEDGIRFIKNGRGMIVNFLYNEKGLLVSNAKAGSYVFVDNKVGLDDVSLVSKTSSKKLDESLLNYPLRKVLISVKLSARIGQEFSLKVSDGKNEVIVFGNTVSEARTSATSREDIIKHLSRVGDTCYKIDNIELEMDDNLFIPLGEVNRLRRDVLDNLTDIRQVSRNDIVKHSYDEKYVEKTKNSVGFSCLVRNEEQLLAALSLVDRVYVTDFLLYQKYKDKYSNIFYRVERANKFLPFENERLLLTEFSQVGLSKNNICVSDYYMNIINNSSLAYLKEKNFISSCLSIEGKVHDIEKVSSCFDTEVIVYGAVELMLIRALPYFDNWDKTLLKDRNGVKYPVVLDNERVHIFTESKEWYSSSDIERLLFGGVSFLRFEFLKESKEEVISILKKYRMLYSK